MAWTIEYARSVQKYTKRLDPVIRKRIRQFLDERLATHENPRELGKALATRSEAIGVMKSVITASSATSRTKSWSCSSSKSAIAGKYTVNP